ncbi:MAG: beta-ketoacyl-[acyl-carrier-protein] synthase II [Gemmatimonadetes bacterium]|nr:beta-ketoacyl-[acyl-carrier-protein] synthase II [Gemmatimonadota bacterium]
MRRPDDRRVVITGLGAVSPVGNDVASMWSALLAGTSGGATISLFEHNEDFPTRIAAEVKGFDPTKYLDTKEARRFDRYSQFGVAAATEAVHHAGLAKGDGKVRPERFGVVWGSGIGGIATLEENARILAEKGPKRVSPFFIPMFIPDIAAGLISIRFGAQGPNYATVSACASSAHAIGNALRYIQRGDADVMIAGGSEATITPLTVAGFASMKAMTTRNDDPAHASRPFDAHRDGFLIAEGAGALIMESLEHAQARGAVIHGEVVGYGLSGDAYHITSPAPEGAGAQAAMRLALADADAQPEEVDYVNAHGTSTPMNDTNETAAIKAVLGDQAYRCVVGSTKSMTGHPLGAAGGIEGVITTLVCREGTIPPTINFTTPDQTCDLDYAHDGMRKREVRFALSNSFGFGGHNVCLAIRRWDGV